MSITVLDVSGATYDGDGGDIVVTGRSDRIGDALQTTPGVTAASPLVYSNASVAGELVPLRGQSPAAIAFHGEMKEGRWFGEGDESSAAAVTVLGPALAHRLGLDVGDVVPIESTEGIIHATVVGVTSLMINDGELVYSAPGDRAGGHRRAGAGSPFRGDGRA